ncbi:hypothetical protein BLNAU_13580 [Blattamonas nauphoetae]|uniref:Uncharacterized protein n=1 Tax=Blattamonas nauphoetae TaxID=2049346 RepID=A0ABQ9XJB8_9EUKA|nr:hypothetical protein BLNAU_13580 [Blattamonas nauphoetae]
MLKKGGEGQRSLPRNSPKLSPAFKQTTVACRTSTTPSSQTLLLLNPMRLPMRACCTTSPNFDDCCCTNSTRQNFSLQRCGIGSRTRQQTPTIKRSEQHREWARTQTSLET